MLLVKKLPSKKNKNFYMFYLKVIKVPIKITLQQAAIAEKIPVLIKVDLFSVIFWGIFIFGKFIYNSNYTQSKNCQL